MIREQKQILIIENRFIIFQNIPPIKIETHLHAFAPIVEAHAFWTYQPLLQVSKNVDLSFYFLSEDYTVDKSSNRCFECSCKTIKLVKCSCLSRCARAHIVVVRSDPPSVVGFPNFLEYNRQTNDCVPLRIILFCVVLVVRLRHVQFFRKNRQSFA